MYPKTPDDFMFKSGRLFVTALDAANEPIGETFELGAFKDPKIDVELDEKMIENFRTSAGGNEAKLSRPKKFGFTISIFDMNQRNMAIARGSRYETKAVMVVTAMPLTALPGLNLLKSPPGFTPTITYDIPDASQPIVVTSEDGLTTYNRGYDFYLERAGLVIAENGTLAPLAAQPGGVALKITFTTLAAKKAQIWTVPPQRFQLLIVNANAYRDDAPSTQVYYNVRFDWTKSMVPTGNSDFDVAELVGEIMPAYNRQKSESDSPYGFVIEV